MKKTLLAMLMIISAVVFAQYQDYNAYDYKASIKRLDYVLTYRRNIAALQKYKVASDTIKGVVLIPKCAQCLSQDASTQAVRGASQSIRIMGIDADGIDMPSEGWFIRTGDKLSARLGQVYVAHDPNVAVNVGKFGANTEGRNPAPVRAADNKYAWMKLSYVLGTNGNTVDIHEVNRNFGANIDLIGNDFLGLTNTNAGYVINTGFGTITVGRLDPAYDPCNGTIGTATSCDMVKSITGTLVGGTNFNQTNVEITEPLYFGACDTTPMWDLCSTEPIHPAVICGTWTLKYNQSLTNRVRDNGVTAVYAQLGRNITDNDVYDVVHVIDDDPEVSEEDEEDENSSEL